MNDLEFKYGHDLYKTGDADAPDQIKDRNGEVALDMCRTCHCAESQLVGVCVALVQEADNSAGDPEPRVRLEWYTPRGDSLVGYMARVSNAKASPDDPAEKLIGYLMKNRHWSPFEMVSACVEINTERDISAQLCRHRSFSFQEFSQRYAEVEDLRQSTECRFQDTKNRQNSFTADQLADPDSAAHEVTFNYFNSAISDVRDTALSYYRELLRRGVAKECARRILPIGLAPSKLYMAGTIRSFLHYLSVRLDPATQREHREIAIGIRAALSPCFSSIFKAAEKHGVLPPVDIDALQKG